jgi:hypothetical protein
MALAPAELDSLLLRLDPSAASSEEMTLYLCGVKCELLRRGAEASQQLAANAPLCASLADLYLHREYHVKHTVSDLLCAMAATSRAVSITLAQHAAVVERLICMVRVGASHVRAHYMPSDVVIHAATMSLRTLVYLATASPVVSLACSTVDFLTDAGIFTDAAARESYARLILALPPAAAPAWTDGSLGASVTPILVAYLEEAPELFCKPILEAIGCILRHESTPPAHASCRKVIVDKLLAANSSNILADLYAQLTTSWMPETEALVRCFVDTGAESLMRIVSKAAKYDAVAVASMGAIPVLVAALLRVDKDRQVFAALNALCALLVCRHVSEDATTALLPHLALLVELLLHPNLWVARAASVAMNRMCTVASQQAQAVATQLVVLGVFDKLRTLCVRGEAAADALYLVAAVLHCTGTQWLPKLQAAGYADACEQLLCTQNKDDPEQVARMLAAAILCAVWIPGNVPSPALLDVVLRLSQPWNVDAGARNIGRRLLRKLSPAMAVDTEWRAAAAAATAAEFACFSVPNPQTCSICMLEDTEEWTALPCCHLFHKECILQWVVGAQRHTCPMCQRSISGASAAMVP